jgi:hypothetical protein
MKKAILLTMFKRLTLLWSLLLMTCFMASAAVEHTPSDMVPADTINARGASQKFYMAKYNNDDTTGWWYFHVNGWTSTEGSTVETTEKNVGGSSYVWTLKRVDGTTNVYEIYNEKYGFYLTNASSTTVTLTKDESNAGKYAITASDITSNSKYVEGSCFVEPQNRTGYYFSCNKSDTKLCVESGKDKGRQILFVPTTFTGADPDAVDYADPDPTYIHYNELSDGLRVFLSHDTYGTTPIVETYCYASKGTTLSIINSSATPTGWAYVWELKKADIDGVDNVYYLYNEYTDTYIGKTGSSIGLVTSKADAGRYMIVKSGDTSSTFDIDAVELRDYDNQSKGLNTNKNKPNLDTDNVGGCNNQFHLTANTFKHYELYLFDEAELFVHPQSETTYYLNLEKNATNIDAVTEADWYNAWVFEQVHEMKTVNVTTTVDNVETTTPTQKWLPKGDGNIYRIINSLEGKYVGKIPASGTGAITLATDSITAGEFAVEVPAGQPNAIRLRDNDTANENCYLVFDASKSGSFMVNGTADDTAAASTSYFYLATVSGLPDRSVEHVQHHRDLYITPHEYRDTNTYTNLGYITAYPEMNVLKASQALNSWQSVFSLESTTRNSTDIWSARDTWQQTDLEKNLNDIYRIYNRINHKYLADITTTAKGAKVTFVDTEAEAGLYQFEYDFLDGTGVAIKGVSKTSASNAPAATKTATADDYFLNFSSDNYLIHGTEDVNSVFYLTDADGESWDAINNSDYVYWTPYRGYDDYARPAQYTDGKDNYLKVIRNTTVDAYSVWKLVPITITDEEIAGKTGSTYNGEYAYGGNEATTPSTFKENLYNLYNPISHKYVKSIASVPANGVAATTKNPSEAGRYRIYRDPQYKCANIIRDIDSSKGADYLNMNGTSNGGVTHLTVWPNDELNRLFYFTTVEELPQAIEDDQQIQDGWTFSIIPYEYFENVNPDYYSGSTHSHAEGYVYQDPNKDELYTSLEKVYDKTHPLVDYSLFQLEQAYDSDGNAIPNVWLIKNVGTGDYVMPTTSTDDNRQQMTSDPTKAGHYEIIWDYWDQTTVYFHDVDNTDQNTAWWWWNNSKSYTDVPSYDATYGGDAIAHYKNNYTSNEDDNARNRFYVYPAKGNTELAEEAFDYLKWILVNTGDWVGDFDPTEFSKSNELFISILKKLDDSGTYDNISTMDDMTETLQETISNIDSSTLDFTKLTNEELEALRNMYTETQTKVADEESRVHPKPQRLYYIYSPLVDASEGEATLSNDADYMHLQETYYERDYQEEQAQQRVFSAIRDNTSFVEQQPPLMWYFEKQETLNGTDAQCYYYIQAANSKKAMRITGNNKVIDIRDVEDPEAALYSLVKDEKICIKPHSVGLRSHWDNDARTYVNGYSLLGLNNEVEIVDINFGYDVRHGSETAVTDPSAEDQNANIWRIKLVTDFPILFKPQGDDYTGKYYNAFYFPFDVQLPAGLTAYSGGYGLLYQGKEGETKKIDLGPLQFTYNNPDTNTVATATNIVPAYTPVVIIANTDTDPTTGKDWRLTVLYCQLDENDQPQESIYKPLTPVTGFGLVGTAVPCELENEQKAYIFHDDDDDAANLVQEGVDYSYSTADGDVHVTVDGKDFYNMQLRQSDILTETAATYVITPNTAYIPVEDEAPEEVEINVTDTPTGIFSISVGDDYHFGPAEPERDANGNLIYFDLMGRRIINPSAGIYILTNGQKVVVK